MVQKLVSFMVQLNMLIKILMVKLRKQESISAGLDYPGVSPLHCFKRYQTSKIYCGKWRGCITTFKIVSKYEKLRPSLEPSHAFSVAITEAKKLARDTIVIVNSCGDAYKDRKILKKRLGISLWLVQSVEHLILQKNKTGPRCWPIQLQEIIQKKNLLKY